MRLSLPLPPTGLNPNRSDHFHKKAQLKATCRHDAFYLCKEANCKVTASGEIAMTVQFNLPGNRKRDADNLLASAKSSIDGVAQALGIDDSRFNPITVVRAYGAPQPGEMVVCIG